ncbi:MAG: tetratricopeptide repeat protein [Microcoleaceae cyanobacterium MO_207.B10]|nr:tetratricopeptide repeat protein [Microcoleaceae cyanobacterium MO_207.B10]
MIGQILDKRYRIIKLISSNILGQTYLAGDTRRPGAPQCVVREIQLSNFNLDNRQTILSLFQAKAEKIDILSLHDKLPNFLAYFKQEDNIYLVEDYIVGLPLSQELGTGKPLLETEVINILEEVLEILVFVHGQGQIHGQITPENLIRRTSDGKLILIGFGLEREIKMILELEKQPSKLNNGNKNSSDSSLYISLEQSQGNLHPNSDIYPLGIIAIRGLTGLSPQDLLQQRQTNKNSDLASSWNHLLVCSPILADIINKMVNSQPTEGYKSASEVLAELSTVKMFTQNEIYSQLEIVIPEAAEMEFLASSHQPSKNSIGQVLNIPEIEKDRERKKDMKKKYSLPRKKQSKKQNKFAFFGLLAILFLAGLLTTYFWQNHFTSKAKSLYNQGEELAKQGNQEKALEKYSQALKLNPKNAKIYYKRGNSYYKQKAYEKAIKDYTAAIKIKSNYNDAYYNRAVSYYELGNFIKAITDLTQTLRLNPNDAEAYYKRGLIYYKIRDYKNSIQDYSQSIRLNPKDTDAYISRGISRGATGDQPGAISDYTQALKINPNDPQAYYSRGRSRFYIADYQGAMADYTKALELKPDYSDAYTNRCSAYLNLANHEAAIEDCTQAIEINPKDIAAYNNRCIGYLNLGEYQRAAEDCSIAIGMNPENAKAYSNRGLARSASGDQQGAIEDYTTAIKINPNDSVAYSNRGMIYSEMGNNNNAIEDFAQAIRLNPTNATAYYNRGVVLSKLQDITAAVEDFRKSANLFLEQGRAKEYQNAQNMIETLKY